MKLLLTLAMRELRGGLREFRLFLGCLIIGVTVIAAVGSLATRVESGIRHEARTLLGGDVEITIAGAPANPEQLEFLQGWGALSATTSMRAMASLGGDSTLIELKGVDAHYPLLGQAELASAKPLAQELGRNRIVIGEDLRERLSAKAGDTIILGDAPFIVSDILVKEPDHLAGGFTLGPRVLAAQADLQKTSLAGPFNLIRYNYRLLLTEPAKLDAFRRALTKRFPKAPWIVKSFGESNRAVQGLVERLQLFLTLAGLSALLIGGVGILNAAEAYIRGKYATVATFKALGATRGTVFALYMTVLAIISSLGIATAMLLGLLLSYNLMPYLAQFFPVSGGEAFAVKPLLLAAAFGTLTVFTFSIAALSRGVEVKPTVLFRGLSPVGNQPLPRGKLIINAILASCLIALVLFSSGDRKVAGGFILAVLACFGLMSGAAHLLRTAAAHIHLPAGRLRLAVAQLKRPGAPIFSIMLAIGMALSVIMALMLVEESIGRDIDESIPAIAPSLFLIDIQPDQQAPLTAFLASKPYVSNIQSEPMVRGRIAKIKGVAVEHAQIGDDAKWATESDRGFTYAATPPDGTKLVDGKWWDAGYRGAPLVSLDSSLARGMGIKVGDGITLNILGQDIDATVASLRDINYLQMRINFAIVFSPGAIEAFPSTGITTLSIDGAGNEAPFVHELTKKFSNLSAVRVRESLAQLKGIVGNVSTALRLTASFALIAGVMVLLSTLAASLDARAYDTMLFKTLGARRRDILGLFLSEWLAIALVTGLLSCILGTVGAWAILKRIGWLAFQPSLRVPAEVLLSTLAFVALAGLALHSRAFALKPAASLRNE